MLFIGFLARTQANKLLHDGTITENEYEVFFTACLNFHKTGFLYALKNFPLYNELLQHARIFNFLNQKCSFESIQFLVEKLQHYITFTPHKFLQLEEEFILFESVILQDFTKSALSEATIRVDIDGGSKTYRINILWYYLHMMKIPGTNKSKFENLFKLAKVVLSVLHSNAEEESLFSRVRKNLTFQNAILQLNDTFSSIISFQLNSPQGQSCYKYEPSPKVIEKAKKVTLEYSQAHSSSSK